MFNVIKSDIQRFIQIDADSKNPSLYEKMMIILSKAPLHALLLYRFLNWNYRKVKITILRKLFTLITLPIAFWYKAIWGIDIDTQASIGKGFYVGHPGGIHIGPIRIGENCNIGHNVTIGIGGRGEERGLPEIGNQIWIGALSVIFGKISIGDHSTILPGTILSKSVPDHVTVAGNPGRVIMRETDNAEIIFGSNVRPNDFRPEI
jgi:serine O-acetyltransferase